MPVRIGCGLSTVPDPRLGGLDAARQASEALCGEADLAVVFCAGRHLDDAEATLEGVHHGLGPDVLIGCGAAGVLACGHEVEDGTAVAVWAADLDGGMATPFHAEVDEIDGELAVTGIPPLDGASGVLLLPDPYSFPTDSILDELAQRAPGVPVLGGLASGHTLHGAAALLHGESVSGAGAVGVRLDGVELLPCVSQGARPVGPTLTITAGEGHIIQELGGEPALPKLRTVVDALPPAERAVVSEGVLLGIVLDGEPPPLDAPPGPADFLVRGLLGGDPRAGTLAVGAPVEPGQVVRLHARDALTADRDLRDALQLRRLALGADPPAGALVFTCSSRGRGLFGIDDHDAEVLSRGLSGAPVAGFFSAGEIGPVSGSSFLHGVTATVAVFV